MKKTRKILLSVIAIFLALFVTACRAELVCISHIDRDGNGKCDNCGIKLEDSSSKSNIKSLTVKVKPTKLEYAVNEKLDVTGGVLLVTYNDGTADKEVPFTDSGVKITEPGMGSKGKKMVAVSYEGKTATYTIEVGDAKYEVSFNMGYDNATPIESQIIVINNKVTKPADPERSGFDFAGWYTSSEYTQLFDFEMTQVKENTVIYAKWDNIYTVTYVANYEGGADSTGSTKNLKAQNKTLDNRDTIAFTGWYTDEACTTKFSFNSDVTANLTLYAGWMDTVTKFDVTFNLGYDGAPAIDTQKVVENTRATKPADPTRTGYDFGGWYKEQALTNEFNFALDTISADTTIYAKWFKTCTVTYNPNYEGAVNLTAQTSMGIAEEKQLENRDKNQFAGWYTEAACTNAFNFTTVLENDITLYAKWVQIGDATYNVTFNLGYDGAPAITAQEVVENTRATKPTDPERTGYEFGGWYKEAGCTNVFNFNTELITADTVIYAKWNQIYKVTYKYNYTDCPADVVEDAVGGKAQVKVLENREGFLFTGWSTNAEGTDTFDFNTVLTGNITLYAKWESSTKQHYTVSYDLNYTGAVGSIESEDVLEGLTASEPVSPTRASVSTKGHQAQDFTFLGWCTDAECKNDFDFDTPITGDITLYAKWKALYFFEAEHTNLVDDDGQPIKGMGASGGSEGAEMVDQPSTAAMGINPSNGYYVTYLFAPGIRLKWVINSDRDVDNVKFIFRISCEAKGFALTPEDVPDGEETANGTLLSTYVISLNGTPINYDVIEITDAQGHEDTGDKRPFSDHVISTTLSLKKGENVIICLTANNHGMGGTMAATAPVIDCIKLEAAAELSWEPNVDNEFGQ